MRKRNVIVPAFLIVMVLMSLQVDWRSLRAPEAWLTMTLLAVLASGSRHYVRFRVSKRVRRSRQVNMVATVVTLLIGCFGLLVIAADPGKIKPLLVWSVLAGLAYPLATVLGMLAQSSRAVDLELYQALTHNGNIIAVPVLLLVFDERPSLGQWTTICGTFALLAVVGLARFATTGAVSTSPRPSRAKIPGMAILLIVGTAIAYASLTIVNKFAMAPGPWQISPLAFLVTSNIVATFVGAAMLLRQTDDQTECGAFDRAVLGYGLVAGILNCIAFYAMLQAYALGNSKSATIAAVLTASVFVATTLNTCFPADPSQRPSLAQVSASIFVLLIWAGGTIFLAGA